MQFRIISFVMAIAALSAMSACGPNKQRGTAVDKARAKAASASGAQNPALAKMGMGQPLPNLADGQGVIRESCPPVSMEYSGSEKEITSQSREILDEGSVFEFTRATIHSQNTSKTGEVGMIAGTVTGPLAVTGKSSENTTAAKVTCHTSKAAVAKGKAPIGEAEVNLPVPAQIVAKSGQASAIATISLQARQGKVGGRVTLMPAQSNIEALLGQITAGGEDKASLTYDTDKNLHYRFQQTTVGNDGDKVVSTIEVVYTKKR